jgi:methylase of polypeptide subunit release factors
MPGVALTALISFLKEKRYQFVTPTPATHQRNNDRPQNERASSIKDAFGWSRPFRQTLLPRPLFSLLTESGIVFETASGWKSSVRASTLEGELFLHSAFPTVSADAVFFGPDTYRFARAIKQNLSSEPRRLRRALDLGCGSGAGGVIITKNASCHELVLTDINNTALQMSRVNVAAAGLTNVVTVESDLFADVKGDFDMIVANPPYLNDPLRRAYRHGGGELGSCLSRRIVQAALERLLPGGTLLLYTGSPIVSGVDHLLQSIEQDLGECGIPWSYEEIDPDVFGEELETSAYNSVDRIAAVVFTARRSGGPPC